MTKYIKGKDGKFAGSIGDGKSKTPTTAPAAISVPVSDDDPAETAEIVDTMYEQYRNARKEAVWEINEDDAVSFWHCGRPGYWEYNEDTDDDEVYCSKCQTMLVQDSTVVPANAEETAFPFTVGEEYTTHKSHITGTIEEIVPNRTGSFRLRLNVDGEERWTTALVAKDN